MTQVVSVSGPAGPLGPASHRANDNPALLSAYSEVCRSYHALDEFRMKLLGFLPLTSLAGIILIAKESIVVDDDGVTVSQLSPHLIGFASFFAAAFTLALFLYEIRGILRCHRLIRRGRLLERRMNVRGQFYVCKAHNKRGRPGADRRDRLFNAKIAASATYSLVFAAWLFLALRFGLDLTIRGCGVTAVAVGLALAVGTSWLVDRHIAA